MNCFCIEQAVFEKITLMEGIGDKTLDSIVIDGKFIKFLGLLGEKYVRMLRTHLLIVD